MTTWNKILHVVGVAAGVVAVLAVPPIAVLPAAAGVVAGGVTTLCAYFASNPISLSNATPAALEVATVAKNTQAALTKGNPNYGK